MYLHIVPVCISFLCEPHRHKKSHDMTFIHDIRWGFVTLTFLSQYNSNNKVHNSVPDWHYDSSQVLKLNQEAGHFIKRPHLGSNLQWSWIISSSITLQLTASHRHKILIKVSMSRVSVSNWIRLQTWLGPISMPWPHLLKKEKVIYPNGDVCQGVY